MRTAKAENIQLENTLNPLTVDAFSDQLSETLEKLKMDHREIARLRLSLEDVLLFWMETLPETKAAFQTGYHLGSPYIEIRVTGTSVGLPKEDDELSGMLRYSELMAHSNYRFSYYYKNGENCLRIQPPKKKRISQMSRIGIAIAAALIGGFSVTLLPKNLFTVVQSVTNPLSATILDIFKAISSPMIFLAVCWGITNIGSLESVGAIAKKVLTRIAVITTAAGAVCAAVLLLLFPMSESGKVNSASGFFAVYKMILNIVPGDIISPFLNRNALQVIFLGICTGVALLILGDRVSVVRSMVGQANAAVQLMMESIGGLVPLFIFLSLFGTISSGTLFGIGVLLKTLLLSVAGSWILMIIYMIAVSLRYKIPFKKLIHKLFPAYLIALTTASSAAAFSTSIETAEKKFGVPSKIVNFALPLGQVLFMPSTSVIFVTVSMSMAHSHGVSITPVWLIIAVIVSGLLAMATSPIPGGSFACWSALFLQLGLPAEALATALAIDAIFDFIATSSDTVCLQLELVFATDSMGMLDKNVLRRP